MTTTRTPKAARRPPRSPEATGAITVSAAASLTEAFDADRHRFQEGEPGRDGDVQLRLVGHARDADPAGRAGRHVRLRRRSQHGQARECQPGGRRAGRLRHEQARRSSPSPATRRTSRRLADLAALPVVSLCADTVPCGKYAAQILQTAGVTIPESNVTRGQDVKATLAAVTTGDADAAIVYVTDAKSGRRRGRRGRRSPTRRTRSRRIRSRR